MKHMVVSVVKRETAWACEANKASSVQQGVTALYPITLFSVSLREVRYICFIISNKMTFRFSPTSVTVAAELNG